MASDLGSTTQLPPLSVAESNNMESSSTTDQTGLVNGDHAHVVSNMSNNVAASHNQEAFGENASLPPTQPTLDLKDAPATAADPQPSVPAPVEAVAKGIEPIADFIPKDVPVHSHPTPPPDQPLGGDGAGDEPELQPAVAPVTASAPAASTIIAPVATEPATLVRPREEDDEVEPAAKRSKLEDEPMPDIPTPSIPLPQPSFPESSLRQTSLPPAESSIDETVSQPPAAAPEAVAPIPAPSLEADDSTIDVKPFVQSPLPQAPPAPTESPSQPATMVDATMTDVKPTTEVSNAPAAPTVPVQAAKYSTAPITPLQKSFISEKMKNLKKTKHSAAFLKPVDYIALNIPQYPEIVKQPMDLGTMEQKLKDNLYPSVQAFADDFALIIRNVRTFNGDAHPVTLNGLSMEAYFNRVMEDVPSPDQAAPIKQKKRSPSVGSKPQPRRESRAVVAPAAAAPQTETFALQADGTPQIRRDSSLHQRPARAIKPPNREMAYSVPKRKAASLELKFCEHVLDKIRGPAYGAVNMVFQTPVDPVALNIPHYRQVVKHPMDLSTMSQKLKNGQYAKANEVKKDFDLMISNCLAFNPQGNQVRDMGIEFQRQFNALWAEKDAWEKANKPESQRQSSDEESEDDEEEDESDKAAQIKALQQQLAQMQGMIASLGGETAPAAKKQKKAKSKSSSKKSGGGSMQPAKASKQSAAKAKAKKTKQVTYEEKQEISEAVGKMNEQQVSKLTQIITENCAKYRDMEEMELEIDDLPNDVQAMLLKYVRTIFGNPNRARAASPDDAAAIDDDDFEPASRTGAGNKRKKHKPMGKNEQKEKMRELQSKLAQFAGGAAGGSDSGSPANQNNDTSGDDESEESEEE